MTEDPTIVSNRRAGLRAPFGEHIGLVHAGRLQTLCCDNVSESGACVQGNLSVGAEVKLFLPVPASNGRLRMLLVGGEVVWAAAAHCGIRFVGAPAESVNGLRAYARERAC